MAKFKIGERARIKHCHPNWGKYGLSVGRQCRIVALDGPADAPYRISVDPPFDYPLKNICAEEWALSKLLPDSDTYHPADISIDDLMRGLKEVEHA